jgi:hypothetical protein
MSTLYFLVIVIGIIAVTIAPVLIIVIVVVAAKAASRRAERELDQLLPALDHILTGGIPGRLDERQIMMMLAQAQRQVGQLKGVHKGMYEARVGELTGMAASAGIDFVPPA